MSPPTSNNDYDWDQFDPTAYRDRNYGFVRPEDRLLAELTANAFVEERSDLDVVDVGTGSNIYPLLAALPRARSVTCWEYGLSNVDWLKSTLNAPLDPVWLRFWDIARGVYAADTLVTDPSKLLSERTTVSQGSIFDLPPRRWDASTMFFCAESITERRDEFDRAMAAWAGAVKQGGRLVGAFMENSLGYDVAGQKLPALSLSEEMLRDTMASLSSRAHIERIEIQDNIRHGYTGMLFLSAYSR